MSPQAREVPMVVMPRIVVYPSWNAARVRPCVAVGRKPRAFNAGERSNSPITLGLALLEERNCRDDLRICRVAQANVRNRIADCDD